MCVCSFTDSCQISFSFSFDDSILTSESQCPYSLVMQSLHIRKKEEFRAIIYAFIAKVLLNKETLDVFITWIV